VRVSSTSELSIRKEELARKTLISRPAKAITSPIVDVTSTFACDQNRHDNGAGFAGSGRMTFDVKRDFVPQNSKAMRPEHPRGRTSSLKTY
jgi:hypothetical protein